MRDRAAFEIEAEAIVQRLQAAAVHMKVQRRPVAGHEDGMDVVGHQRDADAGLDHDLAIQFESRLAGNRAVVRAPVEAVEFLALDGDHRGPGRVIRTEEHTSEHQSLMRNSYDVFGMKKKT